MDDETLLEVSVSSWEFVCHENREQRDLVSESQWQQWASFRDSRSQQLIEVADEYGEAGELSEPARDKLVGLMKTISSATHKSREQLEQEISAREAASQSTPEQFEGGSRERSVGWRGRLKELVTG